MGLYHEAAFTLDSRAIIEDGAPPAIAIEESEKGDDLAAYSDEYRDTLAGDLRLSCEDVGLELTASVEGVGEDATRVVIDWGDGTGEDLDLSELTASHIYNAAGQVTVVATALYPNKRAFEVAKVREMGSG